MSAEYVRAEHETGFTPILKRFLTGTPGAVAVAMVDAEGEAVDYAGQTIDPFDIKVAAATFRIILQELEQGPLGVRGGPPKRLFIGTERRGYQLDAMPDGYALLAMLEADAVFGHASRALEAAQRALYEEAGWPAPPELTRWSAVEVEVAEGRPKAVRAQRGWVRTLLIGRVASGLDPGETGYRVELPDLTLPGSTSHEVTLVRSTDALWYADLPVSDT